MGNQGTPTGRVLTVITRLDEFRDGTDGRIVRRAPTSVPRCPESRSQAALGGAESGGDIQAQALLAFPSEWSISASASSATISSS